MRPTMIIPLKHQLSQFFCPDFITKTAKHAGFLKRERVIEPQSLVLSLIAALSKGCCHAIADLHRQFNGMCLSERQNVSYKPFHNQLRKPAFALFMQQLTQFAMVQFIQNITSQLPARLDCFDDILLQDGSSFRVHDGLVDIFPSRFPQHPAAIECHMTLSLKHQMPKAMTITADTASERTYLPPPALMGNKLLLADAGYVDFRYFGQLSHHGGSFIVRGGKNLNPVIIEARTGQGRLLPKLVGKKLKDLSRKTNRSRVLDLKIKRGQDEFRVIRRWFAEEQRFCIWLTNLPVSAWTAEEIMMIYRCRWQVELLFKELKSDTNWQRFATAQPAIVEGLVWASLLALIIRRHIAIQSMPSVSVYKAGKNVDVWLLPILEAYIHEAWSEITARLEWAMVYISKNAKKSQQRKSKKNITLDGIFEKFSS
jgi:hypothetical protein